MSVTVWRRQLLVYLSKIFIASKFQKMFARRQIMPDVRRIFLHQKPAAFQDIEAAMDDNALIGRTLSGDLAAYGELVNRYQFDALRVATAITLVAFIRSSIRHDSSGWCASSSSPGPYATQCGTPAIRATCF